MTQISEFRITKLYGYRDIKIQFNDNILILIGENGSGKTTILRIVYLFLSGRWANLQKYDFNEIFVCFSDNSKITVKKDEINDILREKTNRIILSKELPPSIRYRYLHYSEKDFDPFVMLQREYMDDDNADLFSFGNNKNKTLHSNYKALREILNDTTILYLPTYRRIEKELSAIFNGIDEDELRNKDTPEKRNAVSKYKSYELVKFGMRDIKDSIRRVSLELNKFAGEELKNLTIHYLSDVVEQKYRNVNISKIKEVKEESIDNIIKRVNTDILPQTSHARLLTTIKDIRLKVEQKDQLNDHEKVICHYFIKLLDFQKQLDKKEERIKQFCNICNTYLIDKQFYYDSSSFNTYIKHEKDKNTDNSFDLQSLSSGEKQIVSIFGTLYLASDDHILILIDEPELSLSVLWQQRFLVDLLNANCCVGLIAATHSPFIFDNRLEQYVHGLGEFVLRG